MFPPAAACCSHFRARRCSSSVSWGLGFGFRPYLGNRPRRMPPGLKLMRPVAFGLITGGRICKGTLRRHGLHTLRLRFRLGGWLCGLAGRALLLAPGGVGSSSVASSLEAVGRLILAFTALEECLAHLGGRLKTCKGGPRIGKPPQPEDVAGEGCDCACSLYCY